jgi:hypothetical protein
MDDKSENEPIENEAARYDLKYIGLDGNIACFGERHFCQKNVFHIFVEFSNSEFLKCYFPIANKQVFLFFFFFVVGVVVAKKS